MQRRPASRTESYHKIHNFIVGQEIAKGTFSTIREAFKMGVHQDFVFKIISKKRLKSYNTYKDMIFSDSVLVPLFNHQHIAKVYQTIESNAQYFHVMDLYKEGDLIGYLSSHNVNEKQRLSLLDQVLSAVEYLHFHFLCHRDIKPDNILLSDSHNAFLTDFGFTAFSYQNNNEGKCGSVGYAAPEVFYNNTYDGRKADVWSIGVLAYSIFAGFCPFPNDLTVSPHVYLDQVDFEKLPDFMQSFVKDCLKVKPCDRPTVSELRNYSCFDGVKRAPTNENPNIESPIDEIDNLTLSKISECLTTHPKEIKNALKQTGVNLEKVLYTLQKAIFDHLDTFDDDFYKTPNLQYETIKTQKISINETISEKSYKISAAMNKYLLPEKFCVSNIPHGTKVIVLNTPHDDIILNVSLNDVPNEDSCNITIETHQEFENYARDLFRFLKSEFSPLGQESTTIN